MRHKFLLSLVTAFCALTLLPAAARADTITAGGTDSVNRFPFGLDPAAPTNFQAGGVYRQVYSASLFTGPVIITQVAFASARFDASGDAGDATFDFTLGLGVTDSGPGDPEATLGEPVTALFSGAFGTALAAEGLFDLVIPITPFTYDPAAGNLLLGVTLNAGTTFTGRSLYFLSGASPAVGRAFDTGGGFDGGVGFDGLRTQFTVQPVPEPATMLLLGTGLAGVGAAMRKRRKEKDERCR